MRPKTYPVLLDAVEVGTSCGIRRAHKHVTNPTNDEIATAVVDAIMSELCERFHLDDEDHGET